MLAVAFLLLLVAGAVVVVGIARVNVWLVAAGAAAAVTIWLACGWLNENAEPFLRVVTLRVRAVDAASGAAVPSLVVSTVAKDDRSEATVYRLPSSVDRSSGNGPIVLVSMIAEGELNGSLVDRLRNPAAHAKLVDQPLEFAAPGYKPQHRQLSQLLPDGWPHVRRPAASITIELDRE